MLVFVCVRVVVCIYLCVSVWAGECVASCGCGWPKLPGTGRRSSSRLGTVYRGSVRIIRAHCASPAVPGLDP